MASSLQSHSLKFSLPVSVGQEAPLSPSAPIITSTSKLSQSLHPATTSASLGTWPIHMFTLIFTPLPPHQLEQRWDGPLLTALAPPAALTRAAVTGKSSSDLTSTCSLRVGQRAGRVRQSSGSEWTAGWHRAWSYIEKLHQGKKQEGHCCANEMWFLLTCSIEFSLIIIFFAVVLVTRNFLRRVEQHSSEHSWLDKAEITVVLHLILFSSFTNN